MRDEHLDSYHQEAKSRTKLLPNDLDADDIQPLLFDLVRLDKVEEVKSILHHFDKLKDSVKVELRKLAASSGSAAMVHVICIIDGNDAVFPYICLLTESIKGTNFETLRWFLSRIQNLKPEGTDNSRNWNQVLMALLAVESVEMFQECENYLLVEYSTTRSQQNHPRWVAGPPAALALSSEVIKATAGCPDREKLLCSFWARLGVGHATSNFIPKKYLGHALGCVAATTCSHALAKVLLEYGAEINSRVSKGSMTALQHAAQSSSPEAAKLMKYLLYKGADPELRGSRCKLKTSGEKGAKGIAKWLGMTWDELIQKVKLDREKGICPPEYM